MFSSEKIGSKLLDSRSFMWRIVDWGKQRIVFFPPLIGAYDILSTPLN